MRFRSALSLALMPAALVAQAPQTLSQRFNAEGASINALVKEFKAAEAMAKAEGLVPAQRPVPTMQNVDDSRAYVYALRLWASTAVSAGQWEKALEILTKRVDAAKANEADLLKLIDPIESTWSKAVADGKAYIAKNATRPFQLEKEIEPIKAEYQEVTSGKKKLKDKKEQEAYQARLNEYNQKNQEINQIKQDLKVHQDNIGKAQGVLPQLAEIKADAKKDIQEAEAAITKAKTAFDEQKASIDKWNADMNEKAKKARLKKTYSGCREWINTLLDQKEAVTNYPTPQEQVQLLNRLLVLDPGNTRVQKAIDNIVAGKDPFFVEKPAKKAGKKATK